MEKVRLTASLRFRLFLFLSIIIFAGSGISWFISVKIADNQFRKIVHNQFTSAFTGVETHIGFMGQMGMMWGRDLASSEKLEKLLIADDYPALRSFSASLIERTAADSLIILDTDGEVVIRAHEPDRYGDLLTSWDVVHKTLQEKSPQTMIVSDLNNLLIYSTAIIYENEGNDKILGLVLIGYAINDVFINNAKEDSLIEVSIIRRRAVMASTFRNSGKEMTTMPLQFLKYQLLLKNKERFEEVTMFGHDYLVQARELQNLDLGTDGSIMLAYSKESLQTTVQELSRQYLILVGVAACIILFLGIRFSQRIISPIEKLSELTYNISEGKLHERIELKTGDEINLLADNFNRMLDTINQQNEVLKKHHEILEQKVLKRTTMLREANEKLQENESSLEEAQRIANLGNWSMNIKTKKFEWSNEVYRIFGLTREKEALSFDGYIDLVHFDDHTFIIESFSEAMSGHSIPALDYRIVRPDGEERHVHSLTYLILGEEKNPIQLFGTIQDITERKKIEEALRNAKNEAEEATVIKDKLVSLVAHDLRGPLGGIQGLLEALHDNESIAKDEETKTLFELLFDSVKNMMNFTGNILNMSKLKSGKMKPEYKALDAHKLAERNKKILNIMAQKKGVTIVNEIEEGAEVYGDPALFNQVVQNLITNAVKFCNHDDTITISMPKGRNSTIAISDTGIGIDKKRLKTLFDYDVKTSTNGTDGESGSGFGLPLCYDIMQAHEGSLTVESTLGEGATFYAELPPLPEKKNTTV